MTAIFKETENSSHYFTPGLTLSSWGTEWVRLLTYDYIPVRTDVSSRTDSHLQCYGFKTWLGFWQAISLYLLVFFSLLHFIVTIKQI